MRNVGQISHYTKGKAVESAYALPRFFARILRDYFCAPQFDWTISYILPRSVCSVPFTALGNAPQLQNGFQCGIDALYQ